MNCRYAREIINTLIDGESHPLAAEARQHIRECESCREWQAEMEQTLGLLRASEAPPMPDIAAMVMSRLPAHHPASKPYVLLPRRALIWLGAAWLVGAIIVAGLLVAILPSINIGGLGHAIGVTKTILSPLSAAAVAVKAAAIGVGQGVMGIARAVGIGSALMIPVLLDVLILAIVLVIWHRRQLANGACIV